MMTNDLIAKIKNPCVMFSNGLGDHFIVLPAIRALAQIFAGKLTLITEEMSHTEVIFAEVPFKHIHRTKHLSNDYFDAEALAKEMGAYDAIISINPWLANGCIERLLELLNPEVAVGFYKCFPNHVPFNNKIHQADLAFSIPLYFDNTLKIDDFAYLPALPAQVKHVPDVFRQQIPEDCKVLVVHAETKVDKMWEEEKFIEVINHALENNDNLGVVLVGMKPLDLSNCRFAERVIPFDQVPFEVSWGVVSCADYFLGVDSVFLHVADLYKIPAVGLFKDESYTEFGIRFTKHRHVVSTTGQMTDISYEEVREAVDNTFFKEYIGVA